MNRFRSLKFQMRALITRFLTAKASTEVRL